MSSSSDEETESESETYEDAKEGQSTAPPIEDNVNKRAGHVTVEYQGEALVWAGYREVTPDLEDHEYWPAAEIWQYSAYTHKWRCLTTTGEIPTRCSGAGACVLDDRMFIVGGFHRVLVRRLNAAAVAGEDEFVDDDNLDEEEQEFVDQAVEISNRIWSLHLPSLTWKAHRPTGRPPLRCDKTACWSYEDKVFVFGGFGPPPDKEYRDIQSKKFQFLGDSSTSDGDLFYSRGWNNQLLYFHTGEERWVWPECSGAPPCPRAAHSAVRIEDAVYIFGGRSDDVRLNDLYKLDLQSCSWSCVLLPGDFPPVGRSWQSLNSLFTGKPEGALLLYGGFDNAKNVLSDCWKLDLSSEPVAWEDMKHLHQGPRLWHTSATLNQSVMIIGGLTNNILAPAYVTKHHADKVLYLRVAPPSLLTLMLEYISEHRNIFRSEWEGLPCNLRTILEIRASEGA